MGSDQNPTRGEQGISGPQGIQGIQGVQGIQGESRLSIVAEKQVDRLIKAARWNRTWIHILGMVCVVLAIVIGVGTWNVNRVNNLVNTTKAGAFSQCVSGNQHLAYEQQVVDEFVYLTHPPTVDANYFIALAAHNFAQRDCYATYNVTPPAGYKPPVAPPLPQVPAPIEFPKQ
jgi:hypothetical protein